MDVICVFSFTGEVKKYPCLCNKADNDYKHEDVEIRLRTAIGEKLEVEGKVTKVDLKKLLSKRKIKLQEVGIPRTESTAV